MPSPALIVGGGIAGLCTAIALGKKGIPCIVFERNQFEDTTGTGIQLTPNATRLLFHAGLENALLETARVSTELATRHWRTGHLASYIPLGQIVDKYCKTPYLQILRSELVQILLLQARQCDNIELRQGDNVETYSQTETSASIVAGGRKHNGFLIIGADGARSTMRKAMGRIPDPRISNWHAWRTTIRADTKDKVSNRTTMWCGPRAHVVTYPVDRRGTVNCVFITKSNQFLQESWRQQGLLSELHLYFREWNTEVLSLLDQIDESSLFRWGLFRHDKLRGGWNDGRCTLVGDAGHCVLPFLAQGAALAIEDAFTLAFWLTKYPTDVAKALTSFENVRLPRTTSIQRRSVQLGRIYHLRFPFSWLRDVSAKWAIHEIVRNIYVFEDIYKSN